jgi:hypothetical protein
VTLTLADLIDAPEQAAVTGWTDADAVRALRELIDGEPVLAVTLRPLAAPRTADA